MLSKCFYPFLKIPRCNSDSVSNEEKIPWFNHLKLILFILFFFPSGPFQLLHESSRTVRVVQPKPSLTRASEANHSLSHLINIQEECTAHYFLCNARRRRCIKFITLPLPFVALFTLMSNGCFPSIRDCDFNATRRRRHRRIQDHQDQILFGESSSNGSCSQQTVQD